MDKKKIVLGLLVITLITATFAGTYAYFTATVSKVNEENKTTTITAKELANLYLVGDTTINNDNMIPGETSVKNIIITNPNEYDTCTALEIYNVTNTFVNQNDVTVGLYEGNNKLGEVIFPSTGNTAIIENLNIPKNSSKTYKVILTYKYTSYDQTADMGKTLIGSIRAIVSDSCPIVTITSYYAFGYPYLNSSPTDYREVGHNVMLAKSDDDSKSVCIVRSGILHCFKWNNYRVEKYHIQDVFSDGTCGEDTSTNVVSCDANDFYCYVYIGANVYCSDKTAHERCSLDQFGGFSCENY